MTTDWLVFWAVIAVALAVDFAASRSKSGARRAGLWSAIWIGLGVAFGGWIALRQGGEAGVTYLTAYLLEKSLSVDNLFVFILIFSLTGIPAKLQPRVLFWGIAGALVMRAGLIAVGVELLERLHWAIYPLAGLLAYAAYRMLTGEQRQTHLIEKGCALCSSWLARFMPIHPQLEGRRFLVRKDGRWMAMACGCALVATAVGFAHALIDGQEAFLLPGPDSPQLSACLSRVAGNEPLRRRVAQAGYRRVQQLRWDSAIERLESAYQLWGKQR